jgi:hypothetical protein
VSCVPANFLTLAQKLAPSQEEIERRCAVSRGYYAALHWAREHLEKCPPIDFGQEKVGSHEKVLRRLREYRESRDALKAAYILADLKTKREGADYDLSGEITVDDAAQVLVTVEKVRGLLEKMPQWKPV